MARSSAGTVARYLRELPAERRAVLAAVRAVLRKNLPAGYRETMGWGLISYEIPLARYPDTYNGQPLCYAGLAAQKSHNALYLMDVYQDPSQAKRLRDGFRKAGKKLDMGKSCLRFKELEDLELEVIGEIISRTPPESFIARYEASRRGGSKSSTGRSGAKAQSGSAGSGRRSGPSSVSRRTSVDSTARTTPSARRSPGR